MTREEKIQKLKSIKQCIIQIVSTYDMGLQVDFLNSKGAQESMGNIGQWPCMKLRVTKELRSIQEQLASGHHIKQEELLANKTCAELCKYHSLYFGEWELEGNVLNNCIQSICKQLPSVDLSGEYFYAYAEVEEWSNKMILFSTYEQMCDFVLEEWGAGVEDYDSMTDSSLDWFWDIAEGQNWEEGISFISFEDNTDEPSVPSIDADIEE